MPPARTSSKSASKRKRAAKKGRAAPKARARRSSSSWRPRLPVVEQRHLDLAGLGLVAVGVFLAFPLWLQLGRRRRPASAVVDGLTWARRGDRLRGPGRCSWPPAHLSSWARCCPTVRPFRAGALCLFGAALLLFGADGEPVRDNGGVVGQALHDAAATAFSGVGASIIAIFLAVAGVLLLTGASVAGVLSATHTRVSETTQMLRRERRRDEADDWPEAPPDESPYFGPPEPAGEEPVVRPRTPRGSLDGALRYPDLFGTPAEIAITGPARRTRTRVSPTRWTSAARRAAGARARAARAEPVVAAAPARDARSDGREQLDLELLRRRAGVRAARAADPQALHARAGAPRHGRPGADRRPGSPRRSAISASRRRSSAPSPARTSRATSCSSRPA